ncbi:globin [Micrococcales bacterium 31B]|nr:globin [Micrococcales bacterium 31B]
MGGAPAFEQLTRVFYEGVAGDPELRALYPEADLGPAERRLRMFFEQYWGGPKTYGDERGHPRLRMRHAAFAVTPEMRDRWLTHMRAAVDSLNLPPLLHETLWDYCDRAAQSLVNSYDGRSPLETQRDQSAGARVALREASGESVTIGPDAGGRSGLGIAPPPVRSRGTGESAYEES